jgi:xylulokinase
MSFIGLEINPDFCRAGLFDGKGERLKTAVRRCPVVSPGPGWAEMNSRNMLGYVRDAISEAASAAVADPLSAICVISPPGAWTPVSKSKKILGHAPLISDSRGRELAGEIRRAAGDSLWPRLNPCAAENGGAPAKLLWLKNSEPALYKEVWKFLPWGALVSFALCGEAAEAEETAACSLMFDTVEKKWCGPLLRALDIDPGKLPKTVPAGTVVGTVDNDTASDLRIPKGVKIIAGGPLDHARIFGAGVCSAGAAFFGLGTEGLAAPLFGTPSAPAAFADAGFSLERFSADSSLSLSPLRGQAGCLADWFVNVFASSDRRHLNAGADIYWTLEMEMPHGPSEVLILPGFAEGGGAAVGLGLSTKRGAVLKALLESSALFFASRLEPLSSLGAGFSSVVAAGGGARSDAWLQIHADILGIPVSRPAGTDCASAGAAMTAALALKELPSAKAAAEIFVKRDKIFEPDMARHELYREKLAKFKELAARAGV